MQIDDTKNVPHFSFTSLVVLSPPARFLLPPLTATLSISLDSFLRFISRYQHFYLYLYQHLPLVYLIRLLSLLRCSYLLQTINPNDLLKIHSFYISCNHLDRMRHLNLSYCRFYSALDVVSHDIRQNVSRTCTLTV